MKTISISCLVNEIYKAIDRHYGYIMGSKGQDPKKWSKTSWWFTQYTGKQKEKALYWREHADRVFDCNGLAEGVYEDKTGININTYARKNYAEWCNPKGSGMIPAKYRTPGAAVFWGNNASSIHHVAYLLEPVKDGHPEGDWWIGEARGVMYGVVKTKLFSRKPNYWGLMTKYFNYHTTITTIKTEPKYLKNGDENEYVKTLQEWLIELGYSCGKWGADGDFGDATEAALISFQKDHNLEMDGIYGPKTREVMTKLITMLRTIPEQPKKVLIHGGQCWIRTAPYGEKIGIAKEDSEYEFAGTIDEETKWISIKTIDGIGWISPKYGKLT